MRTPAILATWLLLSSPLHAATLKGQVVCAVCWFEDDRSKVAYGTQADLTCAAKCAGNGVPSALAVRSGDDTTLYVLDGKVPGGGAKDWLALTSKQVEVDGEVREEGGKKHIAPTAVRLQAGSVAAAVAAVGTAAPDLSFKDLDGKSVQLSSLRGKNVLINFWATWCGPCRAEMPLLERLGKEYAARGITLVAASADGEPVRVKKYLADAKLELPVVWLGANAGDIARMGLGDDALPGTALLDSEGRIVWRHIGVVEEKSLRAALDKLAVAAPPR